MPSFDFDTSERQLIGLPPFVPLGEALLRDGLRAAEVIPAIMLRFARDYLRNRAEIPE